MVCAATVCRVGCAHRTTSDCGGHSPPYKNSQPQSVGTRENPRIDSDITPGVSRANRRPGTRARGWQEVAAGRLETRLHIPRRVFLSLDYAAQESVWKWQ